MNMNLKELGFFDSALETLNCSRTQLLTYALERIIKKAKKRGILSDAT
jgi:hypothetical protein